MLLGDYVFQPKTFSHLDTHFKQFEKKEFKSLPDRKRSDQINRTLLELIQKEPEPCFLLSHVLDFVVKVDQKKFIDHYTFTSFELWLNQFSGLSIDENLHIRGKIAGKYLPRDEYQVLFPIGMNKYYAGSHFVTAHKSPDLDTTIASFWGWLDAFAAKVGTSLHLWNIPGGAPESLIEMELIFKNIFGEGIFSHLLKTRTTLSLTANDLMTLGDMQPKKVEDNIGHIHHEKDKQAIVVVGDEGYYLGDWRTSDYETTRQVLVLINQCIRWFENNLHINLISLFSRPNLKREDIPPFIEATFQLKIKDSDPVQEFSKKEKENLNTFLKDVLGVHAGVEATFAEFGSSLSKMMLVDFSKMRHLLDTLASGGIFDKQGKLIENRPHIFTELGKIIEGLHTAIQHLRAFMEKLDIALKIKTRVFGYKPTFVTVRAEVEEIRNKMEGNSYLTVAYPDRHLFYPVGVIYASDLRKNTLGTVSLRDFCNREEVSIPNYLEIISVVDHHKSQLTTLTPPLAIIGDSQSSNALVAELAFHINDRYSVLGMKKEEIENSLKKTSASSLEEGRALSKLLHFREILSKDTLHYIHPERELIEYIHFLYGIIDDTDLLSKISHRDIICVVQLLNRMKSILAKKPTETVSLQNIPRDKDYLKKASRHILQNEDMYSLYKRVYAFREKDMEKNILLAAKKAPSTLFMDTKEQNGCCRVGQTKMFAKNRETFLKHRSTIRQIWWEDAMQAFKEKPEYDLHLHMVSTVAGADEVYKGKEDEHPHKDELWIGISGTDLSVGHLKRFINAFQESPPIKQYAKDLELELLGDNAEELQQYFEESFLPLNGRIKTLKQKLPIAVLYFKAGTLNSRKAMVSPFLPSVK